MSEAILSEVQWWLRNRHPLQAAKLAPTPPRQGPTARDVESEAPRVPEPKPRWNDWLDWITPRDELGFQDHSLPPLREVLERARRLVSPEERARLAASAAHHDAVIGRFDELWQLGARREALAFVQSEAAATGDGRFHELAVRAARLLTLGFKTRVQLGASEVNVVFGDTVSVGRGAAIDVPSPVVSREHLVLRRGAVGPTVEDAGSTTGTRLGEETVRGPRLILGPLELILGDTVHARLERSVDGLTVEFAGTTSLVALGDVLSLGCASLRFVRDGEPPGYRLVAHQDAQLELGANRLLGGGKRAKRVTACDLARGDRVELSDGGTLEVPGD